MRIPGYFICLLLLSQALAARADVYRCSGSSGEPLFSQRPCGVDSTLLLRELPRRTEPPVGIRPGERAWLQKRARSGRQDKRKARAAALSATSKRRDSGQRVYRCNRKRRALEGVRAKMRRGYKPAQGAKLRRRRAEYEDYLAAFCN